MIHIKHGKYQLMRSLTYINLNLQQTHFMLFDSQYKKLSFTSLDYVLQHDSICMDSIVASY